MEPTRAPARPNPGQVDFDLTPFVAIWETTRACDLACRHCRAEAISTGEPGELSTQEGFALLDELAEMGTPICVLSGGDPAKRPDLLELVRHGAGTGMQMATIPAATPLLNRSLVQGLKDAGLAQMALSLDGPTAEVHDAFRGVPGAFERTLEGARLAREIGLPLQINTTFSAENRHRFDAMAKLVKDLGAIFWEVFFLVPMGRGRDVAQMDGLEFEEMFAKLAEFAASVDFIVKVVEAPHYRRYLMQHRSELRPGHGGGHPGGHPGGAGARPDLPGRMRRDLQARGPIGLAARGVNSGNGHLFISRTGEICPSGFLPLPCGNVRENSVAYVYRRHPVFRELRDADALGGKCGICEFRVACGGSRSRAFAMTGDYLAEEPFCAYEPKPRKRLPGGMRPEEGAHEASPASTPAG
jgi:radical SAM protein